MNYFWEDQTNWKSKMQVLQAKKKLTKKVEYEVVSNVTPGNYN